MSSSREVARVTFLVFVLLDLAIMSLPLLAAWVVRNTAPSQRFLLVGAWFVLQSLCSIAGNLAVKSAAKDIEFHYGLGDLAILSTDLFMLFSLLGVVAVGVSIWACEVPSNDRFRPLSPP